MTLLAAMLGAMGGAIVCALALRAWTRRKEAQHERDRTEGERSLLRLRRELDELEARAREHAELLEVLPGVLWQLFGAGSRRALSPLALRLMDQLFHPERAAVFQARPDGTLSLAVAHGYNPPLAAGLEIRPGQGWIGYVAESGLAMDAADFRNLSALTRRQLDANPSGLAADAAAPIHDDSDQLIGVLVLQGARRRQGQEKRLLRMAASLVGLAHTHSTRLRAIQEAADRDGLTGTYNKRYFHRRLGDELQRAEREGRPLSMLLLDIDHFKHYNDTNGHLEGDEVLRKVGRLLRNSVREDDVAARYGGEEFVVLYSGVSKARAFELAEALRRTVESESFEYGAKQPSGALTLSGGVATFPEDGRSGVDLIRAADHALYEAKAGGRNRIVAATPQFLT